MLVKLCSVEKSIISDPLIRVRKLTKSLVKHRFSLHIKSTALLTLCIVGISRWQKSKLSVFKAKKKFPFKRNGLPCCEDANTFR